MRNGLIIYSIITKMIEQRAYFKWLNGSHDAHTNWIEAELEVHEELINRIRGI